MSSLPPSNAALLDNGVLVLSWADGTELHFPADHLRAWCPCAGCGEERREGHVMNAERFRGVQVKAAEEVGTYALRIGFTDGHALGLYSWERLRELGFPPGQAPEPLAPLPPAFEV